MLVYLKLLLISVIQGVTEWIPISSSAQIVFSSIILGFKPEQLFCLIVLGHLGTLFSSIVFFRGQIAALLHFRKIGAASYTSKLFNFLFTATIFSGLTGVPLYLLLKLYFQSVDVGFVSFLAGVLLVFNGLLKRRNRLGFERRVGDLEFRDALYTGVIQGFSVLPGISRSGITIFTLLMLGFGGKESLTLSYLMSIPAVLGLTIVDMLLGNYSLFSFDAALLVILTSFIAGLACIKFFLDVSGRVDFSFFCVLVGVLMALSSLPFIF